MKTRLVIAAAILTLIAPGRTALAGKPPEKWMQIQGVVNTDSRGILRVSVDHKDCKYAVGEKMAVTVASDRDCFLYLIYYGAGGQVGLLFPNRHQADNRVPANTRVTVPAEGSGFRIVAEPPCGDEVLQVVASSTPIEALDKQMPALADFTPLKSAPLKDMVLKLEKEPPKEWAEARLRITTYDPNGTELPRKRARRYAVCVGISDYPTGGGVPPLRICHQDAERVADALKTRCQVEEVCLLTDEQATRSAIERAIFCWLADKTQAGDEAFIYFSCHGGRCADTSNEKPDGLSKYLVPYDGVLGKPETMILDRVFARWIRELDGRRIGIILDNCYAGGMAKGQGRGIKGIGGARGNPEVAEPFLAPELRRAKAIGQTGVELLAACEGNQIAWEMPTEEGSVLTHFVLQALADPKTDRNGDERVSVGEVYQITKRPIEDYVRKTFNSSQTPTLLDNANDSVYLKP